LPHCAGAARAHLQSWIAAATVIQRGVRSWLFKRRFAELRIVQRQQVQVIVRLQALCRGALLRSEVRRQHLAAATIQVGGWLGSGACMVHLRLVHGASCVMHCRALLNLLLTRPCAAAVQRAWRQSTWMQQQRQELAAVQIQTLWRGYAARQQLARWAPAGGWLHHQLGCMLCLGSHAASSPPWSA
jgi:hypothetical protein